MSRARLLLARRGVYVLRCEGIAYSLLRKGLDAWARAPLLPGDLVEFDRANLVIERPVPAGGLFPEAGYHNVDQVVIIVEEKDIPARKDMLVGFAEGLKKRGIAPVLLIMRSSGEEKISNGLPDIQGFAESMIFYLPSEEGRISLLSLLPGKVSVFAGRTRKDGKFMLELLDPDYEKAAAPWRMLFGEEKKKEAALFPYRDGYVGESMGFGALRMLVSGSTFASRADDNL